MAAVPWPTQAAQCAAAMRFADQLSDFTRFMTEEKGLSPYSVRSHGSRHQGSWNGSGSGIGCWPGRGVEEVDEFLAMKGVSEWNRKSVSVAAAQLLSFMDDKIRNYPDGWEAK
jgi:hypothetical protein